MRVILHANCPEDADLEGKGGLLRRYMATMS